MKDLIFKVILNHRNYPIIHQIRDTREKSMLCSKEVIIEELKKEMHNLSSKEAS